VHWKALELDEGLTTDGWHRLELLRRLLPRFLFPSLSGFHVRDSSTRLSFFPHPLDLTSPILEHLTYLIPSYLFCRLFPVDYHSHISLDHILRTLALCRDDRHCGSTSGPPKLTIWPAGLPYHPPLLAPPPLRPVAIRREKKIPRKSG
jgi:hypothetical protein